ncbi:MAG: ABC transporter ATP-binding protein [Hyphomicrobiaceae bacterium]
MTLKSWFQTHTGPKPAPPAQAAPARRRAAATFATGITFENVERRYGDGYALSGFSLDIQPSEVVCLLGPSGCGKTTLLRIASGIEKPSGGRVLINGLEVAGPSRFVPPEQRSVGLMFQDFALFPHLSILGNVAFGLKSLPAEDAEREAMALLSRVGLAHMAQAYPHVLSGGQQQRVALARAIVPRPAVMLMDEPFSGLDVQLRDAMQEETLALLRETRATSLIVTHHPEEAMRLGDRIAVMSGGQLVQLGSAQELYHHPKELFVARLFSEINEVKARAKGGRIDTALGSIPAPGIADGDTAILCLRERALLIAPETRKPATPSTPNAKILPGRVQHVRFLGDVALVEVAVQGFEDPLKIRTPNPEGLTRGVNVTVEIDPARVLVFPGSAA